MFKATVLHFVDLEGSKQVHTSISGGRATHAFNEVDCITSSSLEELNKLLKERFGKPYDSFENTLYFSIPKSEWGENDCPEDYHVNVEEVKVNPVIVDVSKF